MMEIIFSLRGAFLYYEIMQGSLGPRESVSQSLLRDEKRMGDG